MKNMLRIFSTFYKRCKCPLCGTKLKEFLPFGMNPNIPPRPNALCPVCNSLERHRLIWLYFREKTNLLQENLKLLHIAPEILLSRKFQELSNIDYLSADLNSSRAMVKMDITDIQYPDNSFDVIYCSHVLEHIPEDRKAMRELHRVLRPNGWAILQVPISPQDITIEDPTIQDPKERERLFGHYGHVRKYGHDYKHRLEESGFKVTVDNFAKTMRMDLIQKYGLRRNVDVYHCKK